MEKACSIDFKLQIIVFSYLKLPFEYLINYTACFQFTCWSSKESTMFQESKRKVRANFTAIFEKYSDDTPSDVVDLRTFKIVKDRGQIRNMKERRGVGCAAVWQEVEAGNASLDMFVENAPLPCWADDVEEAEDVDVKHFVSCLRDRSDAMVKVLSQNRALDPSELALWSESGML